LIELLVVIAIIGVMFAIMTPALSSAARAGKQSSCLSNLRQLAGAWHMYALDNEGLIVGGMTGVNGAEPGYEVMWYAWVEFPKDAQGKYTGYSPEGGWTDAPLEDKLRGIRSGLLFGYVDTLKVYHCPSDRRSVRFMEPAEYPAWRSYSVGGGMNVESPYVVHATNIRVGMRIDATGVLLTDMRDPNTGVMSERSKCAEIWIILRS